MFLVLLIFPVLTSAPDFFIFIFIFKDVSIFNIMLLFQPMSSKFFVFFAIKAVLQFQKLFPTLSE